MKPLAGISLAAALFVLSACIETFISSNFYFDVESLTKSQIREIDQAILDRAKEREWQCDFRTHGYKRLYCFGIGNDPTDILFGQLDEERYSISITSENVTLLPMSNSKLKTYLSSDHRANEEWLLRLLENYPVSSKHRSFSNHDLKFDIE